MPFGWLRRRRRRRILAEPFPQEWQAFLRHNVWQYGGLAEAERGKLHDLARLLAAEKYWEGCGGLAMTDEIRLTIAAYAALLVLGLDLDLYHRVTTVLVYPEDFVAPHRTIMRSGLVREEMRESLGEAWDEGVVVLSWADVIACGRRESHGVNVVIHEFAHELDMLNAGADGTPVLGGAEQLRKWRTVMDSEYGALVHQVAHRQPTFLDSYGATDKVEFFAVASETFFERPAEMRNRLPALYSLLCEYYRQSPADRS